MSEHIREYGSERFRAVLPVEPEHEGLRLDQFIMLFLTGHSREIIRKKIKSGDVRIFGRPHPHRPSAKVHDGEQVEVTTVNKGQEQEYWQGRKLPMPGPEVLLEEDDFIVVSKPPFMSAHPTGKHLFYAVSILVEEMLGQKVHSVHRLDRETSGAMILAKNPKTATILTESFEALKVLKLYLFIARRFRASNSNFLARERMGMVDGFVPRQFVHCFPEGSEYGKSAYTWLRMIKSYQDCELFVAGPITGRQHQIRAHAYHHGLSLIGDKIYTHDRGLFGRFKDGYADEDDEQEMIIPRQALHAAYIQFKFKGETFKCSCPLPYDLQILAKDLLQGPFVYDEGLFATDIDKVSKFKQTLSSD